MTTKTKSRTKLRRVTVRLWAEDLDYIREHWPDNYNAQVRRIVGFWVLKHKLGKVDATQES